MPHTGLQRHVNTPLPSPPPSSQPRQGTSTLACLLYTTTTAWSRAFKQACASSHRRLYQTWCPSPSCPRPSLHSFTSSALGPSPPPPPRSLCIHSPPPPPLSLSPHPPHYNPRHRILHLHPGCHTRRSGRAVRAVQACSLGHWSVHRLRKRARRPPRLATPRNCTRCRHELCCTCTCPPPCSVS